MISTNLTLEMLPMDPPKAAPPDHTAPAAPTEIEITAPEATPGARPAAAKTDRFMVEASLQFATGQLDQPLWERAIAQANGDKEAAVEIYVRSRATALRLLDRERNAEPRKPEEVPVPVPRRELGVATRLHDLPPLEEFKVDRFGAITRYRNAFIACAVLVSLAIGGWVFYFHGTATSTENTNAGSAAPPGESPKARAPSVAAPNKAAGPAAVPAKKVASQELMNKIQELRDAENWNVLVFYLAEWTRVEPTNLDAWDQLRANYLNLKQYDDALAAAKRALELAPRDPRMWRNLARVQQVSNDPMAALASFEQAVARNDADADSFTEIGILNAQFGNLPEANAAFDRALAIRPGDPITQCMRSGAAQLSAATKDAYLRSKQVKAIDNQCRGTSPPAAVEAPKPVHK